jgi:histone H3/H4
MKFKLDDVSLSSYTTTQRANGVIAMHIPSRRFARCASERSFYMNQQKAFEELRKIVEALPNDLTNPDNELAQAQNRIFDLLLNDDGQAHKEARNYLKRVRIDLYEKLQSGKNKS